ncbi:MAG TPA: ice-binding family protein [Desulfobaccales bacterium]
MKTMYPSKWLLMGLVLAVVLWFPHQEAIAGQAPVNLRSAGSFAVLATSTITCTEAGTINGDVGVSPGTAFTGSPPVTVNGTLHLGDPIAAQAQADLNTAFIDAAGRPGASLLGGVLDSLTLTPGLYKSSVGSFDITSNDLTLDAQGNPNAVWIFQMPSSTLTVVSGRKVILKNGAQACNIFWQVGSAATLGTNSDFKGNILAAAAITVTTGVTMDGSALVWDGAVSFGGNTITRQPRRFFDQPWRAVIDVGELGD